MKNLIGKKVATIAMLTTVLSGNVYAVNKEANLFELFNNNNTNKDNFWALTNRFVSPDNIKNGPSYTVNETKAILYADNATSRVGNHSGSSAEELKTELDITIANQFNLGSSSLLIQNEGNISSITMLGDKDNNPVAIFYNEKNSDTSLNIGNTSLANLNKVFETNANNAGEIITKYLAAYDIKVYNSGININDNQYSGAVAVEVIKRLRLLEGEEITPEAIKSIAQNIIAGPVDENYLRNLHAKIIGETSLYVHGIKNKADELARRSNKLDAERSELQNNNNIDVPKINDLYEGQVSDDVLQRDFERRAEERGVADAILYEQQVRNLNNLEEGFPPVELPENNVISEERHNGEVFEIVYTPQQYVEYRSLLYQVAMLEQESDYLFSLRGAEERIAYLQNLRNINSEYNGLIDELIHSDLSVQVLPALYNIDSTEEMVNFIKEYIARVLLPQQNNIDQVNNSMVSMISNSFDLMEQNNININKRMESLVSNFAPSVDFTPSAGDEDVIRHGAWLNAAFGVGNAKTNIGTLKSKLGTLAVGGDTKLDENSLVGLSFNCSGANSKLKSTYSYTSVYQLSMYGASSLANNLSILYSAGLGKVSFDIDNDYLNLNAKQKASVFSSNVAAAYDIKFNNNISVTPSLGASFNAVIFENKDRGFWGDNSSSITRLLLTPALALKYKKQIGSFTIIPEMKASYSHAINTSGDVNQINTTIGVFPTTPLKDNLSKYNINIGSGVTVVKNNIELGVGYDFNKQKQSTSHIGSINLRINF